MTVHLLHGADVTPDDREALASMTRDHGGELNAIAVDPADLGSLPAAALVHGGAISCARLLLPRLLPDVDRLIYLDADTLTVSSLAPLGDTALEGFAVAAVCNVVEPAMRGRLIRLGISNPLRYLNSGVLVMDLRHMRELGSVEAALRFIESAGADLLWVDQDTLNVLFHQRWRALHPRWNVQNSFWAWADWAEETLGAGMVGEALNDPAILHFEGPSFCKPWHYLCASPFVETYRAALAQTPWSDQPLLDRTVITRIIARLPRGTRTPAFLALTRMRTAARRWLDSSRALIGATRHRLRER